MLNQNVQLLLAFLFLGICPSALVASSLCLVMQIYVNNYFLFACLNEMVYMHFHLHTTNMFAVLITNVVPRDILMKAHKKVIYTSRITTRLKASL